MKQSPNRASILSAGTLVLLLALVVLTKGCHAASRRQLLEATAVAAAPPPPPEAAPVQQPVPTEYVISNDTLGSFLEQAASPEEHAIIFTTTRLPDKGSENELSMLSNFCRWLDHAGVLGRTLILTTHNATWHTLAARGFPVLLDRVFPERQEYRDGKGSAPDTPNRVFDVQKHYWGSVIVSHGYRALYMDSDVIALKNPLPHFNPNYDVQGLSDWSGAELPRVGEVLHRSCGLYALVPDKRVNTGSMLREWWRYAAGDQARALNMHNPCQSTGMWYVEPTPMAIRFMGAMRDRLLAPDTRHQWDQTAWNEVVLPFLWGMGEEAPLRYRLLPPSSFFGGVGNYEERLKAGLPVDPVALHSGGQHGTDKHSTYRRLGLFYGNFSLPARPPAGVPGSQAWLAPQQVAEGLALGASLPVATLQGASADRLAGKSPQQQEPPVKQSGLTMGAVRAGAASASSALVAVAVIAGILGVVGCVAAVVLRRRAVAAQQASLRRAVVIKGVPRGPSPN